MAVITGSSQSQAPWWRKKNCGRAVSRDQGGKEGFGLNTDDPSNASSSKMEAKNTTKNVEVSKLGFHYKELERVGSRPNDSAEGQKVNKAEWCPISPLEEVVVGLSIKEPLVLCVKLGAIPPGQNHQLSCSLI